jgi:hypothetical protein
MAGLFISGVQASSTDFGKGSQRDLMDAITMVDAKETPFMAMVPKGTAPINALYEWPADKQETPGHNAVADGTAADIGVSDFDNAQTSYDILSNRVQWFRRQAMVGKLAQNVQNQAGIKDHYAHAVTKKLTQLKRDAEVRLCSDSIWAGNTTSSTAVDTSVRLYDARSHSNSAATVAEGGTGTAASTTIGNRTRSLGEFINPGNNEDAIPTAYKCPDGNVFEQINPSSVREAAVDSDDTGLEEDSTASPLASALTESQVENVLQSIYEQVGKTQNLTLLAGPNLKKRFKDFTQTQFGANGTTNVASASAIRSYNADLKDKRIISTVDVYEGDFGTIELVPTLWNAYGFGSSSLDTSAVASQGFTQTGTFASGDCVDPQRDGKPKGYGYLIDWNLLELRFNQMPQVQELPDLGGGRRFAVDMITGLVCKNPLGLGAFKCA